LADNLTTTTTVSTIPSGTVIATDEISSAHVQIVKLMDGTDGGSGRIGGDAANGLDVDVTRLPALAAGTNNIGDVDVLSIAAGDNNIGNVDVVTLPALPAGTNNIGDVDVLTLPAGTVAGSSSLPAGTNNIGDVDVLTLPALPAGTNNIGDVDVLTLPAGTVAGSSSLPSGTNNIGDVDVLTLPSIPAGTNNIGDVDVLSIVPGTGATNQGKAEDAAHTSGDTGVMSLAVRNDAGTAVAGTDLDYIPITTNSAGHVWVTQSAVTPGTAAANLGKAEDAAHASGDTGVMVLAVRQDTQAALAGTTADYIPLTTDVNGSARVVAAGYTTIIDTTLTRPANTTAYAVNDEVTDTGGAVRELSSIARFTGGTGYILGVTIAFSSNWATKPILDLWIFDTTTAPATDNTAYDVDDTEIGTLVTVIPISAVALGDATANTGNFAMYTGPICVPFKCGASDDLFMRVAIRNAGQAGANSDTLKFRFLVAQD
jgi:hypothetical protein